MAGVAQSETSFTEEIVVTAQKREQSLTDVPISLSVLDGEKIEGFGIDSFEALDEYVPNLFIGDSPGNNQLYIRGIGTESGSLALEQSVALFVDGIYGGRARQFQAPFFDVERVEVLRGPQGALVGKNTSAGAISVTTRRPTESTEVSIKADYELEYDSSTVTAIASGPITDNFLGRLAVRRSEVGGYVDNTAKGRDEPDGSKFLLRATGVASFTENLEATFKTEYAETDIDGHPFVSGAIGTTDLVYAKATDYNELDEQQTLNLSATLEWALANDLTFVSITGYTDLESDNIVDLDFSAAPILGTTLADTLEQFSQEFRLVSPADGKFDYVVGLFLLDRDVNVSITTDYNLGPFVALTSRDFFEESRLYSVYGQFNYRFNESFSIASSLRFTDEAKDGRLDREIIGLAPPGQLDDDLRDDFTDTEVDGSAAMQWTPNDQAMFYLSYTQGSKSGAFVGASGTISIDAFTLNPESSESWELGTKLTLLDGRFILSAAYFTTDVEDLQTAAYNGTGFDIRNAADSEVDGFELDVIWALNENWRVLASLGLMDAKYASFPDGPCTNPDHIIPGCTTDLAGEQLAFAPDYSGSFDIEYAQQFGNKTFVATLGMIFKDDTYVHPTLLDEGRQEFYNKVNLRLALESEAGWTFALIGKNIADEETFSQAFETPLSAPPGSIPDHFAVTRYLDPGRTVALEAAYRF